MEVKLECVAVCSIASEKEVRLEWEKMEMERQDGERRIEGV